MITQLKTSLYSTEKKNWDEYAAKSPRATLYHELGWKSVFEDFFGHKTYYIMAKEDGIIKGILPLVLMKSKLFGKFMVSLPFHCIGGACADNPSIEDALIEEAINITRKEKIDYLELRNSEKKEMGLITQGHKASFLLDLEPGLDTIWKDFKKQIRNRIRNSEKYNLEVRFGHEHIKEFYDCYAEHMRDMGLPTHSFAFFKKVLEIFPKASQISIVRRNGKTISTKFFMLYKDTLHLIWGGSLKKEMEYMPNYLLTWETIKYAAQSGYKYCDFGRSTVNTGPFYFKQNWGGELKPLYWQYYLNNLEQVPGLTAKSPKYKAISNLWKRTPLPVAKLIGPRIVKYIP